MLRVSRGSLLHLAGWLLALSGCGSSASGSVHCSQSVADYCQTSPCVMHLQLSSMTGVTESSFCSACGASCKSQLYSFEDCADGTLAVASEVGMSASKGVEFLTYFYDATSLDLTAVIDSTTGGTEKDSLTCLGGVQTLASHGVCAAAYIPDFQCPP